MIFLFLVFVISRIVLFGHRVGKGWVIIVVVVAVVDTVMFVVIWFVV